jgi:nicotinate-nucleotide pyrophosphorylase (carboxylating)
MHSEIIEAVDRALAEDIGSGDVTSEACVPADRRASGYFLARHSMVLAGVELLGVIYAARGGVEELVVLHEDGDHLEEGERIATVRGPARMLLE